MRSEEEKSCEKKREEKENRKREKEGKKANKTFEKKFLEKKEQHTSCLCFLDWFEVFHPSSQSLECWSVPRGLFVN